MIQSLIEYKAFSLLKLGQFLKILSCKFFEQANTFSSLIWGVGGWGGGIQIVFKNEMKCDEIFKKEKKER